MRKGFYRVKGCQRCKLRKVKCDNRAPSCSQCARLSQPCPSAPEGMIFLNAIPESSPPLSNYSTTESGLVAFASPLADLTLTGRHEKLSRLAIEVAAYHTTQWTPKPWILVLNSICLSSDAQAALLHPLRAISKAFEFKSARALHLKELALREYDLGLNIQRSQLINLNDAMCSMSSQRTSKDSLLFLLVMGMLLLEFEMIVPSGPNSWIPHAKGVVMLLGLVGPRASQKSPFFEILTLLRFIHAYIQLLDKEPCMLSHGAWMDIPFEGHARNPLDHMIDILLSVPHQIHLQEPLNHFIEREKNTLPIQSSPPGLRNMSNWRKMKTEKPDVTFEDVHPIFMNVAELTITARVEETAERRLGLSSAILSDACGLRSKLSFSASLQIAFAVNLVSIYSPSHEQQEFAANLFSEWSNDIL